MSWSLAQALERFDLHLRAERSLSPHTARAYRSDLRQFAALVDAKKPAALRPDDPTPNLDPPATTALLEILDRYRREESQAIVIATHNAEVAEAAGRLLRLQDGRLEPMNSGAGRI